MICLKILKNNLAYKDIELQDHETLTIGRSRQNNLILDDARLSRTHCTLYCDAGQWKIKDLQSTAGTMVNGHNISEASIATGDIVKLCDFTIHLTLQDISDPSVAGRSGTVRETACGSGTVVMPRNAASQAENRIEVITGKQKGFSTSFHDSLLVGRKQGCDLVIDDPGVSREHLHISCSGRSCFVKNLNTNNCVEVNGQIIKKSAPLITNAVIKIGETTLKVTLSGSEQKTPSVSTLFSSGLNRKLITIGLPALLIVFFLALMFMMVTKKNAQNESSSTETNSVLTAKPEQQRKITDYMKRGKEDFEKNNYRKALARFQAVRDIEPTHAEAISYAQQCKAAIEKEDHARILQEEKNEKLRALTAKVNGFSESKQYAEARSLLIEAKNSDPENSGIDELIKKNDAEENAFKAQLEEKEKEKAQHIAELQDLYAQGESFAAKNDYIQALKMFNKVLALNVPCNETTQAQQRSEEIKAKLLGEVEAAYAAGLKYYNANDYNKALTSLMQVAEVDPGYKDINDLLRKIENSLEEKARTLYQEGYCLEGLGNREAARAKYKEVLAVMPITTNEYYKKAHYKLNGT